MMAEIFLRLVAELIQGWFDWRPTPRQRVLRALALSRQPVLSLEQREFGRRWLTYGLAHVADLGLESQAGEIQKALGRVASFPWETKQYGTSYSTKPLIPGFAASEPVDQRRGDAVSPLSDVEPAI